MVINLPDMRWVEDKRIEHGWSREDLRDRLRDDKGLKVSMGSLNSWCQGKGHPRDFNVYKALVELLSDEPVINRYQRLTALTQIKAVA